MLIITKDVPAIKYNKKSFWPLAGDFFDLMPFNNTKPDYVAVLTCVLTFSSVRIKTLHAHWLILCPVEEYISVPYFCRIAPG